MGRIALLALIAGCWLMLAGAARAALPDCMSAGYQAGFPGAPAGLDLTCVEIFRFEIATPVGPRTLRAIADLSADWAFGPDAVAAVERGARAAAALMPALGDFEVADITLLLLDNRYVYEPMDTGFDVAAMATTPGLTGSGECKITLFLWGRGGVVADIAASVAHEMFHCVQFVSLTEAQVASTDAGGSWWAEGSAEGFAAAAIPDEVGAHVRGPDFASSVAGGTALNAMSYEAAIFFYWLQGARGIGALMPFLHAMASGGGAGAQHAAMRGALNAAGWLQFTIAYDDRMIHLPGGGDAGLPPRADGASHRFARTGRAELRLEAFVLGYGWVDYECGRWANRLSPATNLAARVESSADWGDFPAEHDARELENALIRYVALPVAADTGTVNLRAERRATCEPCMDATEIDQCVVGSWQLTEGGPSAWLRAQGLPLVRDDTSPLFMSFYDDGFFQSQAIEVDFELRFETRDGPLIGEGRALSDAISGRWAIAEGRMAACIDAGGDSAGTLTVSKQDHSMSAGVAQPGPLGAGTTEYSCSDTALNMSQPMPMGGPMFYEFTRLTPPPLAE